MPRFELPRATRDLLPDDTAASNHLRAEFSRVAESYGFQAIQTPAFEKVELFAARSGPELKSSMLTFHCDHEEYALRPEMTAPVCRLLASGAFDSSPKPYKLYYIAPCFRYCPPSAGRYREFTQAGFEYLGEPGPQSDAEVIAAASRFLSRAGADGRRLKIGNIGIFSRLLSGDLQAEDRAVVLGHLDRLISIDEKCALLAKSPLLEESPDTALFDELRIDRMDLAALQNETGYDGEAAIASRSELSPAELAELLPREAEATFRRLWDVQDLVAEPVAELLLRVSRLRGPLDEVHEEAQGLLRGTKATAAFDELLAVCRAVESYDIGDFELVLGIARGFTFYTSTVFEITSGAGNGGEKYCGGGRYDRLVEEFGGPSLPATGCAFRFDTLADALRRSRSWRAPRPYQVFLLAASEAGRPAAVTLAESLRDRGLRAGVGVGSPAVIASEDCAARNTERIGLLTTGAQQRTQIRLSDGSASSLLAADPDVIAQALTRGEPSPEQ